MRSFFVNDKGTTETKNKKKKKAQPNARENPKTNKTALTQPVRRFSAVLQGSPRPRKKQKRKKETERERDPQNNQNCANPTS